MLLPMRGGSTAVSRPTHLATLHCAGSVPRSRAVQIATLPRKRIFASKEASPQTVFWGRQLVTVPTWLADLLLLAGDIEENPGPRATKLALTILILIYLFLHNHINNTHTTTARSSTHRILNHQTRRFLTLHLRLKPIHTATISTTRTITILVFDLFFIALYLLAGDIELNPGPITPGSPPTISPIGSPHIFNQNQTAPSLSPSAPILTPIRTPPQQRTPYSSQSLPLLSPKKRSSDSGKKSLTILQLNINGIQNKIEELKLTAKDHHADIITLQETKLNKQNKTPVITGYTAC